jgi:hypothetical protein
MKFETFEPGDCTRYVIGCEEIEPHTEEAFTLHIPGTGGYLIVVENFGLVITIPKDSDIVRSVLEAEWPGVNPWTITAVMKWIALRLPDLKVYSYEG